MVEGYHAQPWQEKLLALFHEMEEYLAMAW
jgi:hypothetical protein